MDAMTNKTDITAKIIEDNLKENGNDVNISDYEEEKFLIHFNKTGHEYITDKIGNIIMSGTSDKQDEDNADLYIYDVGTLSEFRNRVNAGEDFEVKIVKITKDIDFGKGNTTNWEPIGNDTTNFQGIFDGQGHTISNIYINATMQGCGLFGYIGTTGMVKNIVVTGNITTSSSTAGGIAGFNYGVIENCGNIAQIKTGIWDAGGIVGINLGILKGSYNLGDVICTNNGGNAGGIAGCNGHDHYGNAYGYIYNCYNNASVIGTYSGGIAGRNGSTKPGYIYNVYSIGKTNIAGHTWSGGIISNYYTSDANTKLSELNSGIDGIEGKNIENPWVIVEEINNGYPVLNWQMDSGNTVPIYTLGQLLKIGNNQKTFINGKIYTFSQNKIYELKNNVAIDDFSGIQAIINEKNIKLN